jgi:3-(3-hydroxy-phenyl)propionate hydroxylase
VLEDYEGKVFSYRRSADQDQAHIVRHKVAVVGAGPVGLALAIDLAQHGIECVLLDDQTTLSNGSRAICFAKRTLEIFDRLKAGEGITNAGVGWSVGKVFFGKDLLYQFDLAAEGGQHRPPFINLQQYVVEGMLLERAEQLPLLEVRFGHRLAGLEQRDQSGARLTLATPDGEYQIDADYVVACDGARSTARSLLDIATDGQIFKDRFLIADVRMRAPFPAERWFWFDPPFHRNQSALLHRQPEDLWRIDFQLGWEADPEFEKEPERVRQRVAAMLGAEVEFDLVWVSVYTFACQRIDQFVHGSVIFAGDAAHGVSPFGARGANGGVQDADNLAWKLAAVLDGYAPRQLLDSYHEERSYATDENILNSTRSTDFITPKSVVSKLFRDAALSLARKHPFARAFVNSGRLSAPAVLGHSSLNWPDRAWRGGLPPGAPANDAPLLVEGRNTWLLDLLGNRFVVVLYGTRNVQTNATLMKQWQAPLAALTPAVDLLLIVPAGEALAATSGVVVAHDVEGLYAERYVAKSGSAILIRPDQHVAARFIEPNVKDIAQALRRSLGFTEELVE